MIAGIRVPMLGPVVLTIRVFRPRRLGDLDNTTKVLQDAFTGFAWRDDSQVVEIHAYRFDCPENPRAEVEIRRYEEAE
jgi:Holliday junction resolvase RusA-like endonuclease